MRKRILALEPYYGGSHQAFLDGWSSRSRHNWRVLGLPARKWKWRMRQAAISFAWEVEQRLADGESWDLLFCSDMLNLAEFLGLVPKAVRDLPSIVYFHENQLTYPVRHAKERDYQFGLTNITTALAADAVWFNSDFHRRSFLEAIDGFVSKMPDRRPHGAASRIREKSTVQPPGIDDPPAASVVRRPGPLRILWVARWEFDKAPEVFFEALRVLRNKGVAFRISVLGQSFSRVPSIFDQARQEFEGSIDRWGYLESRNEYEQALADADVVVSTARHEFFGIGVLEAVAAGAYPLTPKMLSYPEIFELDAGAEREIFFYDGGATALAAKLEVLAQRTEKAELWQGSLERGTQIVARFLWSNRLPLLDQELVVVANRRPAE